MKPLIYNMVTMFVILRFAETMKNQETKKKNQNISVSNEIHLELTKRHKPYVFCPAELIVQC